jgi:hypothetical protein
MGGLASNPRRGSGPGLLAVPPMGVFVSQLEINVAAVVNPFMRAIPKRPTGRMPVAPDSFWRTDMAGPNVVSRLDIEAHSIENCGVIRHEIPFD